MLHSVLLFAGLRELAGPSLAVELPTGATVADLRRALSGRLGPLLDASRIAVNHQFAEDSQVVSAGDELAVIPPVSGG
jgi:molybdopterin converting factor subunit 1